MKVGSRFAIAILIALIGVMVVGSVSRAATEDLLKLVPADWPIVLRVDTSTANASGAYLHSVTKDPQAAAIQEGWKTGFAELLASLGLDVDVDKGVAPWMGEQMVVAVDPLHKPNPAMLVAVACRDRSLAAASLNGLVGSVIRDVDPTQETVAGTQVEVWVMPKENVRPAYAIGDGFVLFGDSPETIKAALTSSGAGSVTPLATQLNQRADDLIAFAVDMKPIMHAMNGEGGKGKQSGMDAMFGEAMMQGSADGGVGISAKGVVLTVESQLPPALMAMLGQFVSSQPPASDVGASLPDRALASASIASGKLTMPFQGQMEQMDGADPKISAAMHLVMSAGNAPIGVALTGFIPEPNYVVAARAADSAQAQGILDTFRSSLAKSGFRAAAVTGASPALYKIMSVKGTADPIGYAGVSAQTAFFASDYRGARNESLVTPDTSLAARSAYMDMMTLTGGPQTVNAWVSLEAISAMGYFYQGIGANEIPISKWIADALKSTNGLGFSAALNDKGGQAKLAVRTTVGMGTTALMAYSALMSWSIAMPMLTTFSHARHAAQVAESESNLKQLGLALAMYADDHGGNMPSLAEWRVVLRPYIKNPSLFETPWGDDYTYYYNARLSGQNVNRFTSPAGVVACYTGRSGHTPTWASPSDGIAKDPAGKVEVVYADSHVETLYSVPPASAFFPKLKAAYPASKAPSRRVKHGVKLRK